MRVEYSAGLVAREHSPSQVSFPTSPPPANTLNNPESLSAQNPPSPFLSPPTRKMSLDFANLRQTSLDSTADHSNGAACSSIVMPLPAARLIVRSHTSRVFCVLQPDTLLAIYAAKGDAKSCDSVILLGTRLLYLVRLSGQRNGLTPSSRDSVSNSRTSSSSNDDAKSLQSKLIHFFLQCECHNAERDLITLLLAFERAVTVRWRRGLAIDIDCR